MLVACDVDCKLVYYFSWNREWRSRDPWRRELGFGGRGLLASVEKEHGREKQTPGLWLAFFAGEGER